MTSVTDPLGNVTNFAFNHLNQLVTAGKVYSGRTENRSYSYDGVGNLRSLTDRNGRITQYDYDNRYRTETETWKTGATTDRTFDYAYDTSHRLVSIDDSDSLATDFDFAYDDRSQRVAESQIIGLVGTAVNFTREFDKRGNRLELAADFGRTLSGTLISTGAVTLYEWDHRNRLESITEKTSAVGSVTQKIRYIYDALDQRVGKRLDSDGDGDFDRDEAFFWTEGQTVLRATDSDGEAATETFTLASRCLYGEMVDQLLAKRCRRSVPKKDRLQLSQVAGFINLACLIGERWIGNNNFFVCNALLRVASLENGR